MALTSKIVLVVYVAFSLLLGIYQAVLFHFGFEPDTPLQITWAIVSLLLIISWIELDCREHKEVYRPFEFGFLLLLFWLFYLPYYLFRTRGYYGILWLIGFVGLSFVGYGLEWLIYFAR